MQLHEHIRSSELTSWVASAVWTHPSAVVIRFTISCAVELLRVGGEWRHNDVIDEEIINTDQNSRSQTAMFSFLIVDRICRQSTTRQLGRVSVGDVYWALDCISYTQRNDYMPYNLAEAPSLPLNERLIELENKAHLSHRAYVNRITGTNSINYDFTIN